MNDNYDYVAIIDWNHGVTGKPGLVDGYDVPANEEHFMFEDDSGTIWGTYSEYISNKAYYTDYSHGVYDMDMNVTPKQSSLCFYELVHVR